ncbi:hypothetical protein K2173_003545 [Erythroxylum novogranatense]|uniref:Embryo defective 1923 n=1 Tax=Erythroxylum novogranatense TaxID=1862640 RepID=A0AAV8TC41_9ROSI|nr:hypothetical protein K2173_003545 [Erythroxylum novogranatense]
MTVTKPLKFSQAMPIPVTPLSSPTYNFPSFARPTLQNCNQAIIFGASRIRTQKVNPSAFTHKRLLPWHFRQPGFYVNADNGEGKNQGGVDDVQVVAPGESTMPERFRYLTKEAPDPPLRWPWFLALGFLIYAWRAVLFELGNWKRAVLSIVSFAGYLLKLLLAIVFHFIGDPITSLVRFIEYSIYSIRALYSSIVSHAPVAELTTVIMLSSAVLALAEAAVPSSVTCQKHLLTLSGLIGYAAVKGYISEPIFWTLLVGLYGFSKLVKKRDDVTSGLPVAAVLAAVGEPWVRALVIISYLALAIYQNSRKSSEGKEEIGVRETGVGVPVPLLLAAMAIGIRLAAKWAGYRHLTWMIV